MNFAQLAIAKSVSLFRPVSIQHLVIILGMFAATFLVGFEIAPKLAHSEWWVQKVRVVNFRDTPYVKTTLTWSEQHDRFVKIALHNSKIFAVLMIAGTTCFLLPVIEIAALGFVVGVACWNLGSPWLYPRFFLPHALLELPLFIYVRAVVLGSGWKWLVSGSGRRWRTLKEELTANLRMIPVLLPLVVLAAFLEAYVTSRW